ncbi:MAG: YolD-like family protein [Clostridium sp.]|nr:YolD-like family protein [Clostridium sp.]MCM1171565.1 YolD-like family protein [Clostridium sp.]
MPKKPRTKMPISERAKQFMPFAAVKGYHEALAKKEHITVPKQELTDDMAELLDYKLKSIKIGSMITVVYYHEEEYVKICGMAAKIDNEAKTLTVVDTKINFTDILTIDIERLP